jgi:hypothetical protein
MFSEAQLVGITVGVMCKVIKKKVISQEWGSGSEQSLGSK